jgi:hypothetical protein
MEVITKKDKCIGIASRWNKQYQDRYKELPDKLAIGQRLAALGGRGTETEIAEIIGNTGWTRNDCDECDKDSMTVVQVGQEPDYDSRTAYICLDCLRKAISAAEKKMDSQQ